MVNTLAIAKILGKRLDGNVLRYQGCDIPSGGIPLRFNFLSLPENCYRYTLRAPDQVKWNRNHLLGYLLSDSIAIEMDNIAATVRSRIRITN